MEASAAAGLRGERPPRALVERPDLLCGEAAEVAARGITWNARLRELRGVGDPRTGSVDDQARKEIVVWLAAQERRAG